MHASPMPKYLIQRLVATAELGWIAGTYVMMQEPGTVTII